LDSLLTFIFYLALLTNFLDLFFLDFGSLNHFGAISANILDISFIIKSFIVYLVSLGHYVKWS